MEARAQSLTKAHVERNTTVEALQNNNDESILPLRRHARGGHVKIFAKDGPKFAKIASARSNQSTRAAIRYPVSVHVELALRMAAKICSMFIPLLSHLCLPTTASEPRVVVGIHTQDIHELGSKTPRRHHHGLNCTVVCMMRSFGTYYGD